MKIKYNKNAKSFNEIFFLKEQRADEITNQLSEIYQELPSQFTVNDFFELAYERIELKNGQEVAFLSYALEAVASKTIKDDEKD